MPSLCHVFNDAILTLSTTTILPFQRPNYFLFDFFSAYQRRQFYLFDIFTFLTKLTKKNYIFNNISNFSKLPILHFQRLHFYLFDNIFTFSTLQFLHFQRRHFYLFDDDILCRPRPSLGEALGPEVLVVNVMSHLQYNQSINQSPLTKLISWSISKSVNQSISKSVNQSVNQSISQSVNQSISQSVNQSISQSVNQSINHQ